MFTKQMQHFDIDDTHTLVIEVFYEEDNLLDFFYGSSTTRKEAFPAKFLYLISILITFLAIGVRYRLRRGENQLFLSSFDVIMPFMLVALISMLSFCWYQVVLQKMFITLFERIRLVCFFQKLFSQLFVYSHNLPEGSHARAAERRMLHEFK